MSTEGYELVQEYRFEVAGEMFAITDSSESCVVVEEVRKNGQEDCHMSGTLIKGQDGKFEWDEGGALFVIYGSKDIADGVRHHLDRYGIPG
jgi:hypothetical protein